MNQSLNIFRHIVVAEISKLKGTFASWLTLIYPLGSVMLVSIFWISMRNNKDINSETLVNNLGNISSFFLPFFIVLIISFACNTDHKNIMLKHILALPVPRHLYYFGKLTGIMFFIGTAFILTFVFAYCSVFLCGFISTKLGFGVSFNHGMLFKIILRAYVSCVAIYSLQFWMGMRLRNLTLPVAIGSSLIVLPIAVLIIMGITGLLRDSRHFVNIITYNPYSNSFSSGFSMTKAGDIPFFSTPIYFFILISVISLIAGAWEFNRRNI